MPAEKATAIVLRVVDFSESSCVVTMFTREFGKIGALAKGGRRPKGPFEAALDLLATCRIVFLRKSSDALDLLTEAKLEKRFRPPSRDLNALYAAYYVAELLSALTEEYDPHPELFDVCLSVLDDLVCQKRTASTVLYFEMQCLRHLGHQPAVSECGSCGASLPTDARLAFGLVDGGALCGRCRAGKKNVVMLSPAAHQLMRILASCESSSLPEKGIGEVRAVMRKYLSHLLGRPLKMHALMGS